MPWEHGGIRGFFATMRDLLIRPHTVFGRMSRRGSAFRAAEFAFLVWFVLTVSLFIGGALVRGESVQAGATFLLLVVLMAMTLGVATGVCLVQGTLLFGMGRFGSDRASWSAAFRCAAYAQAYGLAAAGFIFGGPPPSAVAGFVVVAALAAPLVLQAHAFARHLVRGGVPGFVSWLGGLVLAAVWPVLGLGGVFIAALIAVGRQSP